MPEDGALAAAFAAGADAMALARPGDAARRYQEAYRLAIMRDDARAIGDAGYDEAVADLDADNPDGAVATAGRTRAALALRGAPLPGTLALIEAAALHRLGREREAGPFASQAAASPAADIAERGAFVGGLIAAAQGDAAGLAVAIAQVAPPRMGETGPDARTAPYVAADAAELRAALALLEGRYPQARRLAETAAGLRRSTLDYRAMDRALTLAAVAAGRAGDANAAASLSAQAQASRAALAAP